VRAPEPPSVAAGRPPAPAPQDGASGSAGGRVARALPAVAAVVVAIVHVVFVRAMTAPIIMADEYGYLGGARRILGDGPQTHVPYHVGTALLYLPASALGGDATGAYDAALLTNALLAGALTLAAWWVAALWEPLRTPWPRCAAAVTVGLYTSFLGYSSLAGPEIAFAALELALVGVAAAAVRDPRPGRFALLGAGCGAAWMLHPLGAGVIAAAALVALLALRPLAGHLRALAAFAGPVVAGVIVTAVLGDWVTGAVNDPTQYSSGAFFRRADSLAALHRMLISTFGQAFYLTAATFGLAALGVLELVRAWRRGGPGLTLAFPLATSACVAVISVVAFAHAPRIDSYLYGRYNECVVAPLLLAALAVLVRGERTALWRRYVVTAGGITLALGVVFFALAGSARLHDGVYSLVMVLGIDPLRRRLGWPDPVPIACVAFAGCVLLALVRRFGPLAPLVAVAAVFAGFGTANLRQYFRPSSATRAEERVVADVLNRLGPPAALGCVGFDTTTVSFFHLPNTRLFVPTTFAGFDPGRTRPCGDLALSGRELGTTNGARLVTTETRARMGLWVLPGPRQERLAKAGWLFPVFRNSLPQVARAAVAARAPGAVAPGAALPVDAHVRALGGSPLPSRLGIAWAGPYVSLAAAWDAAPAGGGADLLQTLMPGDTATVHLAVPAIAAGRPLAAGAHTLHVRVLAGDQAIATNDLRVTVG